MWDKGIGRPVWRNDLSVGQQLPGVLEEHNSVAEQAPTLLWVVSDGVGRLPVRRFGRRAGRVMLALHRASVLRLQPCSVLFCL
jgi:hypothetical protein